ncbi:MAG UNVERIFIED_CONTAM: hypothetical protein LVQ98_07365 [Rickettsiaceae bacterium]
MKRGAKLTLAPGGTFTIQDISTENGPASLKIGSGVEICIGDFKFIFEEECQVTYDSSSNGHFNYHLCNLATTHNISITGHTSDAPPAYSE